MLALTVTDARNIATAVIAALVLTMATMAWLIKSLAMKLVTIAVLAGLALAVWSQRMALQDCADRIEARAAQDALGEETTCTFFGQEVTVPGIG
jgi:protein-S-isoprenylcysteine O-methyltransferase Ste14